MITVEILKVYEKFDGDIDGFARTATDIEKSIVTEQQWGTIDLLLQNMHLVKHNLASQDFAETIAESVQAVVAAGEATEWLWRMA